VIDSRRTHIRLDDADDALVLVTCFPFDAVDPGGPLRFEVTAVADRRRKLHEPSRGTAVAALSNKVMS
jgi:sortase A